MVKQKDQDQIDTNQNGIKQNDTQQNRAQHNDPKQNDRTECSFVSNWSISFKLITISVEENFRKNKI